MTALIKTQEPWSESLRWTGDQVRQSLRALKIGAAYEYKGNQSIDTSRKTILRYARGFGMKIETCKNNGKLLVRRVK